MKEQAFLFYQRWREQMKRLPDAERLQIYDAICDFAFENKQSNLAYYLESILDNIRLTIKENRTKQELFIALQKEKGKKSAEARKKKKERLSTEANLVQPNVTAVNVGLTESTNNKNKNKKENNNISSSNEEAMSSGTDDADSAGKVEVVQSDGNNGNKEYCNKVAEYYNQMMQDKQIRQIIKLSDDRRSHILARTRDFGKEAVAIVIQKAARSSFLNGDNDRGFVATFDWIFKPRNFQKTYEGNYDNRTSIQKRTAGAISSTREQRDAEWQARIAQKLYGTDSEPTAIPRMLRDS